MQPRIKEWWSRPCGMREVLFLAFPLMISTMSWTIMQFIDRLFLSQYSKEALAAALPSGVLSFTIICFPLGVAAYVNTFVAQYYGAGEKQRIGVAVWQGVIVGLLTLPLVAVIAPFGPAIFRAAGNDPALVPLETAFFQPMCFGSAAIVISMALSSFHTGRGRVRTIMAVDITADVLNGVLDYALIFGKWGFPEWGIFGAGFATAVSLWFKAAVYFWLFLRRANREEYGTWSGCRFDPELFKRLLRFGSAGGFQYLMEVGAFAAFTMFVAQLGPTVLAAASLSLNVNTLAFMPVYGIGIATTTLVAQRLGDNKPDLAQRATWSAFTLAAGVMAVVASLYVFAPETLLTFHWQEAQVEIEANRHVVDNSELRRLVVVLLRFVACYCLFDAMNIIFSSAIKGAGDTQFVLYSTIFTSGLAVLASWIVLGVFHQGVYAAWSVLTAWIVVLGFVYLFRFQTGKWRNMRVIEDQYLDDGPSENADERPLGDAENETIPGRA